MSTVMDVMDETPECEQAEESIAIKVNGVSVLAKGRTAWILATAAALITYLMTL